MHTKTKLTMQYDMQLKYVIYDVLLHTVALPQLICIWQVP